jgi:hypothetical protein
MMVSFEILRAFLTKPFQDNFLATITGEDVSNSPEDLKVVRIFSLLTGFGKFFFVGIY